jgi:hypothetical protein
VTALESKISELESKSFDSVTTSLTESVGKFWTTIGGKEIMIDLTSVTNYSKAYQQCPPVTSVINISSKVYANGAWSIVDKEGNPVNSIYQKVLDRPNPLQSWAQFWVQHKIYKKIYGNGMIYRVKAAGLDTPVSLWNLPNQHVTIVEKLKLPLFAASMSDIIDRAYITYYGQTLTVKVAALSGQ